MIDLNIELPDGFFDEEIRCDYTVTSKMKEVWAVELDLLNKLSEVCKKYDLKFYADSGTLLGAIRHKGFIPWDDDADVVMLREDYDKLLKVAEKEFNYPYFLQSAYNDKNYYRGHIQLRNSDTTGILPHEIDTAEFNQGIFLDIFPLDRVSKYKLVGHMKHVTLRIRWRLLYIITKKNRPESHRWKYFVKKLIIKLWNILKIDEKDLYKSIENSIKKGICKGEDISKVFYYSSHRKYKNYKIIHKEWYGEPKYVDFEHIKIPIPEKYDDILKMFYGNNYMTPLAKKSGHGELIVDASKSYIETLRELKESRRKEK